MLSKQADPLVPDSVGGSSRAIGEKPDGHETATNTTSPDQVVVNITTDTSDSALQSAEAGIAPINEATGNATDPQQVHGQQADIASHISGLDVHIPRSNLLYGRDSNAD